MSIETFAIATSFASILFALWLRRSVTLAPDGNPRMVEIAEAIREGSQAFLRREFQAIFWVGLIIAFVLWFGLGWMIAVGFTVGAIASALAAYIGMQTAVLANSRVAERARTGLTGAFLLAFRGGAVTGFLVVGLGLFVVAGFWKFAGGGYEGLLALIGVGFGGSLISVF